MKHPSWRLLIVYYDRRLQVHYVFDLLNWLEFVDMVGAEEGVGVREI